MWVKVLHFEDSPKVRWRKSRRNRCVHHWRWEWQWELASKVKGLYRHTVDGKRVGEQVPGGQDPVGSGGESPDRNAACDFLMVARKTCPLVGLYKAPILSRSNLVARQCRSPTSLDPRPSVVTGPQAPEMHWEITSARSSCGDRRQGWLTLFLRPLKCGVTRVNSGQHARTVVTLLSAGIADCHAAPPLSAPRYPSPSNLRAEQILSKFCLLL